MSVGEQIMNEIIAQGMLVVSYPDPDEAHVFVWSSGAAEQLEAVVGAELRKHDYEGLPTRHETFGRLMWDMIQQIGGSFCGDEWSEEVLPLAQQAGLCHRAKYDPEIHWEVECAEPGDEIWVFGEEVRGE